MKKIDIRRISPNILNFMIYTQAKEKPMVGKISPTYRFFCLIKGSMRVTIGAESTECEEGSVFYLPPGTVYTTAATSEEIVMLNIFFDVDDGDFDVSAFDKSRIFSGYKVMENTEILGFSGLNAPGIFRSGAAIHICNKLMREIQGHNKLKKEFMNLYLHQIILCLAREDAETGDLTAAKITGYIKNHINEPLDGARLAEVFSYHPNYIARVIKKTTGKSLGGYILDEKLRAAENLVCHTDYGITDIAFRLSFENSSHFSRKFREKYGMSPTEYRKKYS